MLVIPETWQVREAYIAKRQDDGLFAYVGHEEFDEWLDEIITRAEERGYDAAFV